jgi:hypothetical protein
MIQTACAWILLLLAASPVTAPFAVCDLRALVAHEMSHGLIPLTVPFEGSAATVLSPAPAGGDAFSLSPFIMRILPKHSGACTAVGPVRAVDRMRGPGTLRHRTSNLSSAQLLASATVLRL